MERQVGVSAVTVIVALLIGGKLLGIVGAILAVPTAAILQVLFNEFTTVRRSVASRWLRVPAPASRSQSASTHWHPH